MGNLEVFVLMAGLDKLRDYWVYGKAAEARRPRWSVVRDVLGWME